MHCRRGESRRDKELAEELGRLEGELGRSMGSIGVWWRSVGAEGEVGELVRRVAEGQREGRAWLVNELKVKRRMGSGG